MKVLSRKYASSTWSLTIMMSKLPGVVPYVISTAATCSRRSIASTVSVLRAVSRSLRCCRWGHSYEPLLTLLCFKLLINHSAIRMYFERAQLRTLVHNGLTLSTRRAPPVVLYKAVHTTKAVSRTLYL